MNLNELSTWFFACLLALYSYLNARDQIPDEDAYRSVFLEKGVRFSNRSMW